MPRCIIDLGLFPICKMVQENESHESYTWWCRHLAWMLLERKMDISKVTYCCSNRLYCTQSVTAELVWSSYHHQYNLHTQAVVQCVYDETMVRGQPAGRSFQIVPMPILMITAKITLTSIIQLDSGPWRNSCTLVYYSSVNTWWKLIIETVQPNWVVWKHKIVINSKNIGVINDMMGGEGTYKAAISDHLSPFHCLHTRRARFWLAERIVPNLPTTMRGHYWDHTSK